MYELNVKNADCSRVNKDNDKNYVYTHIIPYFEKYKLCDIYEDDCQRFLNQYVGKSKAMVSKLRMTLRRIMRKAKKQEQWYLQSSAVDSDQLRKDEWNGFGLILITLSLQLANPKQKPVQEERYLYLTNY